MAKKRIRVLSVRLTTTQETQLRKLARYYTLSRSQLVVLILERALAAAELEQQKIEQQVTEILAVTEDEVTP